MKHLPKHLRPRYRYLAVELSVEAAVMVDRETFQRALWRETRALYGDAGSATIDPRVIRFDLEDGDGTTIVRTRRDETDRARAAIACIETIDGAALGLRIVGTSGTVRGCSEQFTQTDRS